MCPESALPPLTHVRMTKRFDAELDGVGCSRAKVECGRGGWGGGDGGEITCHSKRIPLKKKDKHCNSAKAAFEWRSKSCVHLLVAAARSAVTGAPLIKGVEKL